MNKQTVSISIGPGQHSSYIIDLLKKQYELKQSFHIYPEFLIKNYEKNVESSVKKKQFYRIMQYATWALWTRLPYLKFTQHPRALFLYLADRIISKNLTECDLFIGWPQISLQSIRAMKSKGSRVMLEHQMSHIQKWTQIIDEEYDIWRKFTKGFYSRFSKGIIEQMIREYEEADFINVLSTYAKKSFIENGVTSDKIIVTPFGVDTERFHPKSLFKKQNEKIRILYVGRIELLKGVQYLLEAFIKLKRRDIELYLVGPILPEMMPLLERYDDQRIKPLGSASHDELLFYYQNCDIFVFPSINDAFGLVVLEAMACGLPVITTENSCAYDVVTDGINGFVIPIRNPEAIREKLDFLLECEENRTRMAAEARKTVEQKFSLLEYEKRYLIACEKAFGR